jgi:hypothetical protein
MSHQQIAFPFNFIIDTMQLVTCINQTATLPDHSNVSQWWPNNASGHILAINHLVSGILVKMLISKSQHKEFI